jgi:TnpA family transposase
VLFYTHVSDQYAPFHTKVINATVRDATHVLDGWQGKATTTVKTQNCSNE